MHLSIERIPQSGKRWKEIASGVKGKKRARIRRIFRIVALFPRGDSARPREPFAIYAEPYEPN